jgi:hypothetical protein
MGLGDQRWCMMIQSSDLDLGRGSQSDNRRKCAEENTGGNPKASEERKKEVTFAMV